RGGRQRPPDRRHSRATWTWRCRARRASIRELRSCGTGPTLSSDRAEQGGVKPAAVLVCAFEINVGRPGQIWLMPEHGNVTGTGFEPDVDDIGFFAEFRAATLVALSACGEGVGFGCIPGIGAEAAKEVNHFAIERRIIQ